MSHYLFSGSNQETWVILDSSFPFTFPCSIHHKPCNSKIYLKYIQNLHHDCHHPSHRQHGLVCPFQCISCTALTTENRQEESLNFYIRSCHSLVPSLWTIIKPQILWTPTRHTTIWSWHLSSLTLHPPGKQSVRPHCLFCYLIYIKSEKNLTGMPQGTQE